MLLEAPALASPVDLYGSMPNGVASANALTASSEDGSAAYYNPAGLGVGGSNGRSSVQLSYVWAHPMLYVARTKNDPATLDQFPTNKPPTLGFYALSALMPLGGKIRNRASLGMLLYMPRSSILAVETGEPVEPQWLRYQSEPERITLAVGLGVRPIEMLSVGVGLQMLASFAGRVSFRGALSPEQGEAGPIEQRHLSFRLKPAVAPTFGLTFIPKKNLRIAASFRGGLGLEIGQPVVASIQGIGSLDIAANGTMLYTPPQVSAGVHYAPLERLSLALDLRYELWSQAPLPAFHVGVVGKDELLGQIGGANMLTNEPAMKFIDRLTAGLSAKYDFGKTGHSIRGGYALRPGTVGNLSGPLHNYLEATTHLVGLGGTLAVKDPLEVFTQPLLFDLAAQAQVVPRQAVTKSSLEDPVGNYAFGGAVFVAAASVRYEY
jgi:hypothetical protein